MISNKYFTIRLLRYGQQYTERVIQKSNIGLRQQSNKLVLFKGIWLCGKKCNKYLFMFIKWCEVYMFSVSIKVTLDLYVFNLV